MLRAAVVAPLRGTLLGLYELVSAFGANARFLGRTQIGRAHV